MDSNKRAKKNNKQKTKKKTNKQTKKCNPKKSMRRKCKISPKGGAQNCQNKGLTTPQVPHLRNAPPCVLNLNLTWDGAFPK